jgi:hypothetical protein
VNEKPKKLLKYCEANLGESGKEDLDWYTHDRPKWVTPKMFFAAYSWALLVLGLSRKSARTWIKISSFWSIFNLTNCRAYSAKTLIKRVGSDADNKFGKKSTSIHKFGRDIVGMNSKKVADEYFGGIRKTVFLRDKQVNLMKKHNLPFVK